MHTKVLIEKGDVSPSFAIDDRIFLGEGLFETIRVSSSQPCFAELHWQRISKSAWQLGIPFDLSLDDWEDCLVQQIKRDNLYHGGMKVILSGGSAPRGLAEHGQVSQLIIQTFNYSLHNQSSRLCSASWLRDAANPVYQLKTINYLEAITARRQALAKGMDDALFFNMQGHATETTCANLFLIRGNQLFTPALDDGVLAGITRSRILAYCQQEGITCLEGAVDKKMLLEADALFTTNALQGIKAVASLDATNYAVEHEVISRLQDWFGSL
ncbi:MAG: 4-amino-4-deoxychorismate lyase [Legionella sp.]|nr:MAG: 4-amino-4-deoxychorismate lyase [Legionella sp.]